MAGASPLRFYLLRYCPVQSGVRCFCFPAVSKLNDRLAPYTTHRLASERAQLRIRIRAYVTPPLASLATLPSRDQSVSVQCYTSYVNTMLCVYTTSARNPRPRKVAAAGAIRRTFFPCLTCTQHHH